MSGTNGTRRGLGPKKKKDFLKALTEGGTVSAAAKKVGVGRTTAYRTRGADAKFAEAWDEVYEEGTEKLESKAMEKALAGDGRMIEFMLKSRKPHKYRDRLSIDDDRDETRRRRELETASEDELDERLTGVEDNVIPIRKAS